MQDIIATILGLALIGGVASIPIGIFLSFRKIDKEWAERKLKDEAWLAAELAKPRSHIEFITVDDVVHTTGPHDPYDTAPGSEWGSRRTSKQFADACLEGAYKRGYFMDEERNSFPTCNVKSAKVVTNEQQTA